MSPERDPRDLAGTSDGGSHAEPDSGTRVATVTIDVEGKIQDFDPEAERLFGHTREEVLGARLSDVLVPPRLRGAHDAGLTRYRQSGHSPILGARLEMPALRADGQELTVELTITRTVVGGQEMFIGTMHPVEHDMRVPVELRQSEQFHRTLVEESPTVITVINPDGTWRWSSGERDPRRPGAPSGSSRRMDELIDETTHPDDRDKALHAIVRALHHDCDGEPYEIRVDPTDGQWQVLSVRLLDLLDHPAVHGVVAYATDVTRASRAERREEVGNARLSTLIGALGVGVLMQDDAERVVLTNTAFTRLFGLECTPDGLYGSTTTEIVERVRARGPAERTHPITVGAADRVGAGTVVSGEQIPSGHGRVVERDYVPIRLHGQTLGHLWVFRDVTDQVAIRRGLEERNRALAELSALKTQFVSAISHELRTPLTSIATFAEMLGAGQSLPLADRQTAIDAVARNADRMLRLVEDLVLIGQMEAGSREMAADPVDVPALVEATAERVRPAAEADGVQLDVVAGTGPETTGDQTRLHQALMNLLHAAVVATGHGGSVRVASAHRDGVWMVDVESLHPRADLESAVDNGLDAETTGRGVSMTKGAAMAIMFGRTVATRHGGGLTAVRTSGGGVAYSLTLPVTPPARTTPVTADAR